MSGDTSKGTIVPRKGNQISGAWAAGAFFLMATGAMAQTVTVVLPEGQDALRDVLQSASLTANLGQDTPADAQSYVAAARADYRRLLTGLYSEGYYSGTISIRIDGREAANIAPLDAPTSVSTVTITVDPGPAFIFGEAQIAPILPDTILPESFATGEVARSGAIQSALRAALAAWQAEGYAKAAPAGQQITAVHPAQRLNVNVTVDPGPRLSWGTLSIEGNEAVRTERIRQIAGLPRQGIYDPKELDRAAARLRRTGTFSSATFIESETVGPDDTLPFTLQVVEMTPRRIGAGAELASDQGLTVSAFWLHRNLLGGAERFQVDAEVSNINTTNDGFTGSGTDALLRLTFNRPSTFRRDIDLVASAEIAWEDEENYQLESADFEVGITQYVRNDLTYNASLGLRTAVEESEGRTRSYILLTLPLQGTLDQRNAPLNATDGFYLDLEVTPFLGVTGAANGVRAYADGRAYRSLGKNDRLVLAGRAQIGSILGAGPLEAPADYLFYSGGGGTVRGQPYQSLGITSSADFGAGLTDVQTGGTSFVGAQLEARLGITDTIGAVGFYDIGLVGDGVLPSRTDTFQAGAGIGLRYNTGIGPIRLDVGTPVTGDSVGERIELYIGIGQAF